MKAYFSLTKLPYFFFFFLWLTPPVFSAQNVDHALLDQFLKRVVDDRGQVNYRVARENPADLDRYLKQVEAVSIGTIEGQSKPEQLAFWMNLYHAELLAQIIQNYPLRSTQDIPNFWDKQFVHLGSKKRGAEVDIKEKEGLSLTQIRRDYLIEPFQNEKIHLGLAMAAKDGPLFPREAYTGAHVLGQLFKKVRMEVNRNSTLKVNGAQSQVYLSKIFEWYAPDFIKNFSRPQWRGKLSRPHTAVINFLIHYCKTPETVRFLKSGKYKIEYLPFDWSLNDQVPATE